ncbi:MAG: branched-chain amino acid ABC transporter permease [Rhizobiaceae bacterium]|nr:branched-chain amino acid ABC transporter permease [Hyphomicrobiales bacterium]NRB30322.1 branched-chain amino acid ABC transporter permease [Rhizobiaceae bacterium]
MTYQTRVIGAFSLMAAMLLIVGFAQSWSLVLAILNLCLISSIMALGLNMQWGYAGLFNAGVMGFAALGGAAAVIVSVPPVQEAWAAGGGGIMLALIICAATALLVALVYFRLKASDTIRFATITAILVVGFIFYRMLLDPSVDAIEAVEPAKTGFLGGLGMPIIFSWLVGGLFAAGIAWVIGKVALGLRSDYFAIATLGISEIIVAVLKNEDWLTRGVKNVNGLPRPVPYEIEVQQSPFYQGIAESLGVTVVEFSSLFVKLCYSALFLIVLLIIFYLSQKALNAPWGRMMRAIRDNETAANAMGKHVTGRHLQVFILGSAVIGIAGAMLTTLDGQFTPTSYQPLRFTFLVWVMVIVGGSGNNLGSILGGFFIWFFWIEAEPIGLWMMEFITSGMAADNALRLHLIESAPHMRLIMMGVILLLVLRFSARGILPEQNRQSAG